MDTYVNARPYPGMNRVDECNWLPAARNGERWALEEFYQGYQAQIYALCHRMLGRVEDAEDAMQASFLQAFRELPRFRGDSMARTWLYRIATNEAITILRRRNRIQGLVDEKVSIPDNATVVQRRLAVQSSLTRLRADHRVILVLRYWEDLSYEEIAAVLDVSLPTVKMRLCRARAEFRRVYGEEP